MQRRRGRPVAVVARWRLIRRSRVVAFLSSSLLKHKVDGLSRVGELLIQEVAIATEISSMSVDRARSRPLFSVTCASSQALKENRDKNTRERTS